MNGFTLARGMFAVAEWWRAGAHLGIVTSVKDPDSKGRVQVKLPAIDPSGDAPIWARVAVPFAGDNFGAFLIPDVGSEVLVVFVAGDTDWPVVVGNFWNGATGMPDSLPSDKVDRWTFTGKNGTRIAIVEEGNGQEKVEISTPAGATATLTDESGGEIKLEVGTNSITMGTSGISVQTGSEFKVQASTISLKAGTVDVQTGSASFSMAVECKTFTAVSVTSGTYSLGAGNTW